MKFRKMSALLLCGVLAAGLALTGCSSSDDAEEEETEESAEEEEEEEEEEEASTEALSGTITVVSREDGSGTRGAFIELFGIEQENEDGEDEDMTTTDAVITNNTQVMMTTVQGDTYAIGYCSLGSLSEGEGIKAVNIEGIEATTENVTNGTYEVSRPFNIVTQDEISDVAQDFIDYILSAEGQAIIADNGYVSIAEGETFESSGATGSITIGGSSSVSPVMEKLAEAYQEINTGATIEIQTSDSTTGVTNAIEGSVDIGMASRDLKDEETGVTATTIAMDGIAVIVNEENPIDNLTIDQVMQIFTGAITDWSDVQ